MATTLLTAWYDDIVPYVPGCPLPVALQKIREATIRYCRLARTWRFLGLTAIDAVATQQTYVIGTGASVGTLPADTVVVHVFQVNYNGVAINSLTPRDFRAKSDLWFSDQGDPEAFTLFNEGEISFWRIPSASLAGGIRIPEVALGPTQTAMTVDDRVYQHGREAIAHGARGLIHAMPKKPYSDPQLAQWELQQFEARVGSADLRASSGRGHARLRSQVISR